MEYTEICKQRWFRTWKHLDAEGSASTVWKKILRQYSQPHRHYHTLEHIHQCLNVLETIWDKLPDPYLLSWSLWFHDYYYDIGSHENEERSGILSIRTALDAKLPLDFAVQSSFLIFATEKHEILESQEVEKITMQAMLDIDLSILAKPWHYYLEYAKNIREEYKHFSWEEFSVGRARILEKFLKRDILFYYPPFRDLFESRAKENLIREINILRTMKEEDAYVSQA